MDSHNENTGLTLAEADRFPRSVSPAKTGALGYVNTRHRSRGHHSIVTFTISAAESHPFWVIAGVEAMGARADSVSRASQTGVCRRSENCRESSRSRATRELARPQHYLV